MLYLAEDSSREYVLHGRGGGISNFVVEPASADTLTLDGVGAVGYITNFAETWQFNSNGFFVVLIVGFLDQLEGHLRFDEIQVVVMIGTGNSDVCALHNENLL